MVGVPTDTGGVEGKERSLMRTRRYALLVLVLVLLVGLATACGVEDRATAPMGESGTAGQTVDEFLGTSTMGFGGPDEETRRKLAAQDRQVEELVADCMTAEGFEYTPPWIETEPDETFVEYETLAEFRAAEGYGVFGWLLRAAEGASPEPPTGPPVDPNLEYVQSLSTAEEEAYRQALYGSRDFYESEEEWAEVHPGEPMPEMDPKAAGCRRRADQEILGRSEQLIAAEADLYLLLDELDVRVLADSRVVDAEKQWVACMADHGYSFSTFEDIFDYLYAKKNELEGREPSPEAPTTTEALAEGDDSGVLPPGVTIEMVRNLFQEELAIAGVDIECSVDRDAVRDAVRRELESEWIAYHRELLEQVRDLRADEGE